MDDANKSNKTGNTNQRDAKNEIRPENQQVQTELDRSMARVVRNEEERQTNN